MKCLIVGQGIAGTMLAWSLLRQGVHVELADAGYENQSSSLAAGIINPITGKRLVKTWRFDDLFPAAKRIYQQMEAEFGVRIWHDQVVLRLFEHPHEINDWAARMASPGYTGLLSECESAGAWAPFVYPGIKVGKIHSAARIDFPLLLFKFRERLAERGIVSRVPLSYNDIEPQTARFDAVIFCEGYRGAYNPFFPELGWQLSKGEALILRIPDPRAEQIRLEMLKRSAILVPLKEGDFWAGATYEWTFDDNGPTEAAQGMLEQRVGAMLNYPYQVLRRIGAVRPTVKDRRPLLGQSRVSPKFFIFNGLGTKGALLAPHFAECMADHLLHGKAIDPEVDIQRFC